MNEQVMYWISAASNRPQISNPMELWSENLVNTGSKNNGGLWMWHNYIKQVRFEGNHTKLIQYVVVGASVSSEAGVPHDA
jgi:hypothetical protein